MGVANAHVFTNKEGHKLEAEIISKTTTHVKLKVKRGKKRGRVYDIALDTLSEADRKYVAEWKDKTTLSKIALAKTDLGEVLGARGFIKLGFDNENDHLFATITIKGQKLRFLLDTGAMGSYLKESVAEKLGLKIRSADHIQVIGAGGAADVRGRVDPVSLELGGEDNTVKQGFTVLKMSDAKEDGILGSNFFRLYKGIFIYEKSALWLKLK